MVSREVQPPPSAYEEPAQTCILDFAIRGSYRVEPQVTVCILSVQVHHILPFPPSLIPGASGGGGTLVGREFTPTFKIFSVLVVAFGRFSFLTFGNVFCSSRMKSC